MVLCVLSDQRLSVVEKKNTNQMLLDIFYNDATHYSQLTPVGTTIIRDVVATDKDADNWYITYEIDQNQSYAVSSSNDL